VTAFPRLLLYPLPLTLALPVRNPG
jgi:hypothetical protein